MVRESSGRLLQQHRPLRFTEFSRRGLEPASGMSAERYLDELRAVAYDLSVIDPTGPSQLIPQSNGEVMRVFTATRGADHLDLIAWLRRRRD